MKAFLSNDQIPAQAIAASRFGQGAEYRGGWLDVVGNFEDRFDAAATTLGFSQQGVRWVGILHRVELYAVVATTVATSVRSRLDLSVLPSVVWIFTTVPTAVDLVVGSFHAMSPNSYAISEVGWGCSVVCRWNELEAGNELNLMCFSCDFWLGNSTHNYPCVDEATVMGRAGCVQVLF